MAAFSRLYEVVKDITIKNMEFKPTLEAVKGRVHALRPLLADIHQLNKKLLHLEESEISGFNKAMEDGADLFRKCSRIHGINIFNKASYKNKLDEFDKTLERLIQILLVQGVRDCKETSIKIQEMYDDIMRLQGPGVFNKRGTASCDVPQLPSFIRGLDGPLEEIKKRLLYSDKSLLLLTARGGCGKTLLAQMFCHDSKVKGKFKDNIFFVTVSRTPPTLSEIVQQLYKHKRKEVPALVDEVDAREHMKELLNQIGETTPVLLVLDDVWDGYESLVKKLVFDKQEYKILVTSRYELKGCGQPHFASPYLLNPLNDDDAMALFRHWASLENGNAGIPEKIVKEIVDYYKAFPLSLKIVAGSLYKKPLGFWQSKLKECSNASLKLSTESTDSQLLASLKSQLEDLNATVKECFMDLGLFPGDKSIPAASLIDMWTELYHLNEDADAIGKLFDLTIRNLASLIVTRKDVKEVDGYYSEHFVIQDGLLRDLSTNQSSEYPVQWKKLIIDLRGKNQLPNWWDKCEKKSFKARLLAISSGKKLPSELSEMKLPEVEALVLNFWSKDYDLPEFVKKLANLKVLIVTSHKEFLAKLKNFELLGPSKSLRRIRLERISIPSLTLVPLENLRKISFYRCSIGKAFSNCKAKFSDLFPNLMEMNVDFCYDLAELPDEICDVQSLEKLSVSHCTELQELPKEIGKLKNLKELRLRSCTGVVRLPDSIRKLSNLTFLDIYDCMGIESLPEDMGDLSNLIKLNMKGCSGLRALPRSFEKLTQLEDLVCDKEKQELWEQLLPDLSKKVLRLAEEDTNLDWLLNPSSKITV